MNDREKALKNFIELLFFIDKENKKFLDKIFKSKYISYSKQLGNKLPSI